MKSRVLSMCVVHRTGRDRHSRSGILEAPAEVRSAVKTPGVMIRDVG